MKLVFIIALLGVAIFNLGLALRGWRRGIMPLHARGFPRFDSDREDDPVGFQVAVLIHVTMGLIALLTALWLVIFAH